MFAVIGNYLLDMPFNLFHVAFLLLNYVRRSVRCEFVERRLTCTARRLVHASHACMHYVTPGLKERFFFKKKRQEEHRKQCSRSLPSRYQTLCLAGLVRCSSSKFYLYRALAVHAVCRRSHTRVRALLAFHWKSVCPTSNDPCRGPDQEMRRACMCGACSCAATGLLRCQVSLYCTDLMLPAAACVAEGTRMSRLIN